MEAYTICRGLRCIPDNVPHSEESGAYATGFLNIVPGHGLKPSWILGCGTGSSDRFLWQGVRVRYDWD